MKKIIMVVLILVILGGCGALYFVAHQLPDGTTAPTKTTASKTPDSKEDAAPASDFEAEFQAAMDKQMTDLPTGKIKMGFSGGKYQIVIPELFAKMAGKDKIQILADKLFGWATSAYATIQTPKEPRPEVVISLDDEKQTVIAHEENGEMIVN
ncbi:MAG: hypothetical protein LBN08_00075 [Lactobacillales bacterium]|jgi:PBP1b-binding outer membrane lipoprotein LpoB|nr:hypothetical protein [Lactobacillales bacterium]